MIEKMLLKVKDGLSLQEMYRNTTLFKKIIDKISRNVSSFISSPYTYHQNREPARSARQ